MNDERCFVTLTQTGLNTRYALDRLCQYYYDWIFLFMFGRAAALGDKCTRWNMFYIYYYHIADNPSDLLCYLDVILGGKSRLFRNDLSLTHNKQITFLKQTKNSFPCRRHRAAVGGCGQRINVPSVKASGCGGFGSELAGGSCSGSGNQARGASLTVRCSRQKNSSSTAAGWTHFMKNQTKGRHAAWMEKQKDGSCQLSWTHWSWSLAAERQRRGKFRSSFLTQTLYLKMLLDVIWSRWVQLKDIPII